MYLETAVIPDWLPAVAKNKNSSGDRPVTKNQYLLIGCLPMVNINFNSFGNRLATSGCQKKNKICLVTDELLWFPGYIN